MELNPLTLGEMPEGLEEMPDGSVLVKDGDDSEETEVGRDFYENLAELLPENELQKLSSRLLEAIEKDQEARKKRDEKQAEGLRRTGLGDDAPGGASFEGASKVVHPVLAEVSIDFAASAMKELYPPSGPVKTEIFAKPDQERLARAERKRDFMNWQLTKQMPEYRDELEQLVTQLPMGGSQFQKFWHDDRLARPCSEFVPIDNILLPNAATSFYTAHRATHVLSLTKFEFDQRVKSKLYREVEIGRPNDVEKTTSELANEKIEGKEGEAYDEDGLRYAYEIYVFEEIADPVAGEEIAPYIITIDQYSEKVLAIYRNWEEQDPLREKLDWFVEWKFIPWRGAYAVGLPHLIGSLSGALTGTLRAILDSAHIQNSATALKLKGGRVQGQNLQVEMTQVADIDAPPGVDDIRKVIMPFPFAGPSPVLFQLLGFLSETAKGVASTAEEKISEASNQMPVGTAMALIEQGSKVFSSIHSRMHNSQKKALEILDRINRKFPPNFELVVARGGPELTPEDFQGPMDVIPVSDPNIFSETQRFAQLQGTEQLVATSPDLPWNRLALKRRMLNLMHVDNPDELLPQPPKPVTGEPVMENMTAANGGQIHADMKQNHLAHMQSHLGFILDPILNNMVPPPALGALLTHFNQHMLMYMQGLVQSLVQQVMLQMAQTGAQPDQDTVMAMAQAQVQGMIQQQLGPMMQAYQQAQQIIQQKTPPPPMPPEVQASLQIAQMENQRKSQMDQATNALKTQEAQTKGQMEAAKFQFEQQTAMAEAQREAARFQMEQQQAQMRLFMDQSQQAFEQRMAQMQASLDNQAEQLRAQVELMKNNQDNEQHQMTELLKNHEDNQTNLIISKIREELKSKTAMFTKSAENLANESVNDIAKNIQGQLEEEASASLSAVVEDLQKVLDQKEKQMESSLVSVVESLKAAVEASNKPKFKRLVFDEKGNAIGVQEES